MKDHQGTTSSLSGLVRSFRKIQTVSYCGWLDKMRVRKGPGSTYELWWNSMVIIVMQKLPHDIPVLFEIIKRSFIMASAIHKTVRRVSLGWQYGPAVQDLTFLKPVEPAWSCHTCFSRASFNLSSLSSTSCQSWCGLSWFDWVSQSVAEISHPRGVVNGFVGKIAEGTEIGALLSVLVHAAQSMSPHDSSLASFIMTNFGV